MIIKLYGEEAKQLANTLNLEVARGEKVIRRVIQTFKLTSVEGRDIVEIDIA